VFYTGENMGYPLAIQLHEGDVKTKIELGNAIFE